MGKNKNFEIILKKTEDAIFQPSSSRTTQRRIKNGKSKGKEIYFGIGLSFNIDGNRANGKVIYKNLVKKVKNNLNEKELNFLINRVEKNFYKISKNVSIKDVNSRGKLFMHILFILPYIKYKTEQEKIKNIQGLLARTLYNCTRSWYTNYCKKKKNTRLTENQQNIERQD